MPRKILALACVVVGLHIIEALTFGTSTLGSFSPTGCKFWRAVLPLSWLLVLPGAGMV